MNIVLLDNHYLHWWGESILVINSEGYYQLDEIETFFVKHFEESTNVNNVKGKMCLEMCLKMEEVDKFIDIFLENYKNIFKYVENTNKEKIKISGKQNQYYPFDIQVSLTSLCNQFCAHCYKNAGRKGREISYGKLVKFLNDMSGKVPYLTLTGGNPLNYPNFKEIIKSFSKKYHIYVMTSGYNMNDEDFEVLKMVDEVKISIYSASYKKHDNFVNVIGSFNNIMENIEKLIKQNISVSISTLLAENNFNDIKELIELLINKHVSYINIGKIVRLGRAKNNKLFSIKQDKYVEFTKRLQKTFEGKIDLFLKEMEKYLHSHYFRLNVWLGH